MVSEAYRILVEEMRLYLSGRVAGRALLISGHRGAGKTTLVRHAIQYLDLKLSADLAAALAARPSEIPQFRQRPLLVKLNGPSLLERDLPKPGGSQPDAAPAAAPPAPDKLGGNEGQTAQQQASAVETAEGVSTSPAHGALVQITIALYRALARELSEAFAAHAHEKEQADPSHQVETAAQLRLDLDRAVEPGLLKSYWEGVDALRGGVVWGPNLARQLVSAGVSDQGFREIVAIATAAQAFQVCSGAVKYSEGRKSSGSLERTSATENKPSTNEVVSRLFGLVAGGVAGFGTAQAASLPTPIAVGAGLVGSLLVASSVKRSSKLERNEDYTFILDRSIQTLERDLPLVIDRLRQAGLAPIFLIDELDKLQPSLESDSGLPGMADDPASQPRQSGLDVSKIIRRLKHLTTDYGFFCFLTDRDYYEDVERRILDQAFPEEHTFFSDRIFVLYTPAELNDYVISMIVAVSEPEGADPAIDELARHILAKVVLHDARCSTIDVVRRLARDWDAEGKLSTPSETLLAQPRYRLATAVQIAVECVLQDRTVETRCRRDPSLRQILTDALYTVSRAWERDERSVDLGHDALATHVSRRLRSVGTPDGGEAMKRISAELGSDNAYMLSEAVQKLVEYLCDFSVLRSAVRQQGRGRRDDLALRMIEQGTLPDRLLLRPATGNVYGFAYDYDGNVWSDRSDVANGGSAEGLSSQARSLLAMANAYVECLSALGQSVDPLVAANILPREVSLAELQRVRSRMQTALDGAGTYETVSADMQVLEALRNALNERGNRLRWTVDLALDVLDSIPTRTETLGLVLDGIARHVDTARLDATETRVELRAFVRGYPSAADREPPLPSGDLDALQAWRLWLVERTRAGDSPADIVALAASAWARWLMPVCAFARGLDRTGTCPGTEDSLSHFDDLVLAGAGRPPGSLLRRDLQAVKPAEWSELALMGCNPSGGTDAIPSWAVVASLRVLRFGRDLLMAIAQERPGDGDEAYSLASEALPSEAGVLLLQDEPDAEMVFDTASPYLILRRSQLGVYGEAADWLARLGAFRIRLE